MAAFPDIGHTVLFRDPSTGLDVLHCDWTGEWKELPSGPWQIGYDGRGVAVILGLDGPMWASQALDAKIQQEGDVISVCVGGVTRPLQEHFGEHERKTVVIQPFGAGPVFLDAAVFKVRAVGAFVWWSLPSLHARLGIPGVASAWYHRMWLPWVAWLRKLRLQPPHCRRASATKAPTDIGRSETLWSSAMRCLPYYSVSSYALLALFARWSSDKYARLQNEDGARAFRAGMAALLRRFFGGRHDMQLFLKPTMCVPGVPMDGELPVVLTLCGGLVDLQPLLDSPEPVAERWCALLGLASHGPLWELGHLIVAAFDVGHALCAFFSQLVMCCGQIVDNEVKLGQSDERVEDSIVCMPIAGNLRETAHLRLRSSLADHLRRKLAEKMSERKCQYIAATRNSFAQQVSLHIAIDASRMGQKQIFLACLALADGTCAVCPPQAC